jgi:hypothetical protein
MSPYEADAQITFLLNNVYADMVITEDSDLLAYGCKEVCTELQGPGKLLGYRAMNQKLRTKHNVKVPRHLVHNMMHKLDAEGIEGRNLQKKAKPVKKPFTSEGPLWVISLDRHHKLCGYQYSTFLLGVYDCMDTFTCKIQFIFVCYSNPNPLIVGKKYLGISLQIRDTSTISPNRQRN